MLVSALALALVIVTPVRASPLHKLRSTSVSMMTSPEALSYEVAAQFASTAYCKPSTIINWSCGDNCDALGGFLPHASGGDGTDTQFWYVGYDPTFTQSIVVAHQGTDPYSLVADLTDADFFLEQLNATLFPGVPISLEVHAGFQASHQSSAAPVLAAVQAIQAATGSQKVLITGHSLGAALALLDAVYLPLHLPSSTQFTTSVFGMPRVGNHAFADYVDSYVTNLSHVTNKLDIVPTVPFEMMGFVHPSGEKHIVITGTAPGDWYACVGQDNTSSDCSTGAVLNILDGDVNDHAGPYGTVTMGC